MKRSHWLGGAAAVLGAWLGAGCSATLPPVRVEAKPADLQALVGEWSGEYSSEGLRGRNGSILFTLAAGEDHAHGDVLMTPAGAAHGYGRFPGRDPFGQWDDVHAPSESLTIHFVRVDNRFLSGALDPYWDPDRECWASTTFRGELVENVIAGTFRTTFSKPAAAVEGRWRVTRRPPRPERVSGEPAPFH